MLGWVSYRYDSLFNKFNLVEVCGQCFFGGNRRYKCIKLATYHTFETVKMIKIYSRQKKSLVYLSWRFEDHNYRFLHMI